MYGFVGNNGVVNIDVLGRQQLERSSIWPDLRIIDQGFKEPTYNRGRLVHGEVRGRWRTRLNIVECENRICCNLNVEDGGSEVEYWYVRGNEFSFRDNFNNDFKAHEEVHVRIHLTGWNKVKSIMNRYLDQGDRDCLKVECEYQLLSGVYKFWLGHVILENIEFDRQAYHGGGQAPYENLLRIIGEVSVRDGERLVREHMESCGSKLQAGDLYVPKEYNF